MSAEEITSGLRGGDWFIIILGVACLLLGGLLWLRMNRPVTGGRHSGSGSAEWTEADYA